MFKFNFVVNFEYKPCKWVKTVEMLKEPVQLIVFILILSKKRLL